MGGDPTIAGPGPWPISLEKSQDLPSQRLIIAEAQYRTLVEQIPAITFVATLNRGLQDFYVSPQIEKILGFTQKEWLENPILWYQQLHPDDRERWQAEFAKTVFSGTAFRAEYRFLARGGKVVWVRGEAQMVRDGSGNPLFLQGVAFDITEQKEAESILTRSRAHLEAEVLKRTAELDHANRVIQAEARERERANLALCDREAKLRSIVEFAVDGILVIDRNGIVETFNPAAERIFGYAASEVIGENVRMLMPAPYRQEHDGYIHRFLETGHRKVIGIGRDVSGRRKDGTTFPMELGVSETPTPEGIKFTGFVRDVTDRKKAEEALIDAKIAAEAASKLKGEFLANMSHEIRTPMNGIIGMTDFVLETELAPSQRESLEIVKSSADSLMIIINDILDFSKIEAGKLELEQTDFNLREMLTEMLKPISVRAYEKGLELAYDVDPDVPEVVVGDAGRLRQILVNLIGNALKFTSAGEIILRVRRDPDTGAEDQPLRFSVSDTGIGIPAEKQELIFESFTQADGSTTRKFGGTGLGLSICRHLVSMMNGRIWLESRSGHGSTFQFTAILPSSSTPGKLANGPKDAPSELTGVRVLIVEDHATNSKILEKIVIGWEMAPTICHDGGTALETMSKAVADGQPYPILILDDTLPDMNVVEVIRRLDEDPSMSKTAIIMLAIAPRSTPAASFPVDRRRCCLTKPVSRSGLLAAIRTAFDLVRTPDEIGSGERPPNKSGSNPSMSILLAEGNVVSRLFALRLLEKQGHRVLVARDGEQALDLFKTTKFDLAFMDDQMLFTKSFRVISALRARETNTGARLPVIALTDATLENPSEILTLGDFDEYVKKPIQWPQMAATIDKVTRSRPRSGSDPRGEQSGPRNA